MKRNSKQPDCKVLEFAPNQQLNNIYDLITTSTNFNKFKYFRLEKPLQPYLLQQGVKYVCESWEHNVKTLHTGLIPTGNPGYFVGDFVEFIKGVKKNSLIIFKITPEKEIIYLYFFNHFNKKSIRLKLNFARVFINDLNLLK